MLFRKKFLQELTCGDYDDDTKIISNEITDTSRWSILHEMIFKTGDKYYITHYLEGATEYQDEIPYEYDPEEIECEEVVPYETTVIKYRKVTDETYN